MADQVSTLALKVDSSQATAGLQQMGHATDQLSKKAMDLKQKLIFLGGTYLSGHFGKQLLNEAAEGQEALGKFQQVLGRFTKEANGMVEELRANFNFNATDAQAAISTMADQFHKFGASMRDSLDMTFEMQKLAGDLAAFTNIEGGVAAASQALSAGLMGQTIPLKKLGIVITDEMTKERMATEAKEGLTFASKRAAQMHAREQLILEQTAAAHGQVAREADNYSNKLRKYKAVSADFRNELGDAILPIATQFMTSATKIMQGFEKLPQGAKTALVATVGLTAGIKLGAAAIELTVDSVKRLFGGVIAKTAAEQKDTAATAANTTAETTNAAASNATATSKNLEASARMRNAAAIGAENAALNSQSTANITSTATGGAHHMVGKGAKAAKSVKLVNMASNPNAFMYAKAGTGLYAGRTSAGRMLGGVGAKAAGAALGGTASAGIMAQAASGAKKFLGVFKPMNGAFMKGAGFLGKLVGKFALMLPFVGKLVGFLGKSAIIGTVVKGLAKFGSIFIPFVGWISTAITALELFKNAPQWLEAGIDKLGSLGEKIPGMLKSIGAKALEAGKKVGIWIKDTIVGGILGIGQVFKRLWNASPFVKLAGWVGINLSLGETEAQRAYKLNKQMEEIQKRRQLLLDAEMKQRETEKQMLIADKRAKDAERRAKLASATARDTDQTKLVTATRNRDETQGEIDELKDLMSKNNEELASLEKKRVAIQAGLQKNAAEKQEKIQALYAGKTAAEQIAQEKQILEDRKKIEDEYAAKDRALVNGGQSFDRSKLEEADRDKSIKDLLKEGKITAEEITEHGGLKEIEEALEGLAETHKSYAEQIENTTEKLVTQEDEVEKLTDAVRQAAQAAEEESKGRQESEKASKNEDKRRNLQWALDDAKTNADRQSAIGALTAFNKERAIETLTLDDGTRIKNKTALQSMITAKGTEIDKANERLLSDTVAQQLDLLQQVGEGDTNLLIKDQDFSDVPEDMREEFQKEAINLAMKQLRNSLEAQGFNLEKVSLEGDAQDVATNLRDAITKQQKEDVHTVESLKKEYENLQGRLDTLNSLQEDNRSLKQQSEETEKSQIDALREADEEERNRQEERTKLERQRAETFNEEMYQRQLTAIEDSGMNAIDTAAAKYDLMAGKGASAWEESQSYMENIGKELFGDTSVAGRVSQLKRKLERNDYFGKGGEEMRKSDEALLEKLESQRLGVSGRIRALQEKQRSGTATEDDLNELQRLQSRRDELQSDYDSEYDKALSNRWSTEKELYGLQKTMADEQDKQIRDYVTQQGDALKKNLEEEEAAAQEIYEKRLAERSEVEKEQRQAVSGAKAIAAGTSEAFQIQSKIYNRGQENLPPEKKIQKSTEKIEKYVEQLKEQMYQYLSGNTAITLSMGY